MLSEKFILPKITSTCLDPLHTLERHFLERREVLEKWFDEQWRLTPPPVYGSVDLRNAAFKVAPIDMNLFPAGFNNLNPNFLPLAVKAAKKSIHRIALAAKRILIIPESHTRNLYYWENVNALKNILTQAGFEARFALLQKDDSSAQDIQLPSGNSVTVEQLRRQEDKLCVDDFTPDLVLLNNDLSAGIPDVLQGVSQMMTPPAELGWSQRLKSDHFQYYAQVADEFGKIMEVDPWLVSPLFRHCGNIDFMAQAGMECLISDAEKLMEAIKQKYQQYNITHQPFLIIKADAGTYGMAVMTVRNVDELKTMNRKQRTRMATIKDNKPVNRVIIQEGVYTFETAGKEDSVAEPVVYLFGDEVIGGFYRVHTDRGVDENLNAPGMHFVPLPFPDPCNAPCQDKGHDVLRNRFYVYGVVARLSMLAAAREIKGQV